MKRQPKVGIIWQNGELKSGIWKEETWKEKFENLRIWRFEDWGVWNLERRNWNYPFGRNQKLFKPFKHFKPFKLFKL
jgi:hypothetical protein